MYISLIPRLSLCTFSILQVMESWAGPGNEASCIWYGQECLMHVFGVVMCSCMAFQQNELAIITNFRCMQVIVLGLLSNLFLKLTVFVSLT